MFRHDDESKKFLNGQIARVLFVLIAAVTASAAHAQIPVDTEPISEDVGRFVPPTRVSRGHDAVFQATGLNMWGTGSAFQRDESFFLGVEWGNKKFTPRIDLGKNVLQAFLAGKLHDGRVGLESNLTVNSGSWDVSYPVYASYEYPLSVTAGDEVTMTASVKPWSARNRPSLTTSGPEARYSLDYVTDFEVTYGVGFDTGLSKTWTTSSQDKGDRKFDQDDWDDRSLFNRHRDDKTLVDINKRTTLVDVGSGATGTMIPLGDWGELNVQIPEALKTSTSSFAGDGMLKSSNTSEPWAEMEADLIQLASNVPVLAPLKALSGDLSFGGLELDYDLLSVSFNADVELRQEFEFRVTNVGVHLEEKHSLLSLDADLGPLDGTLEHDFTFTAPVARARAIDRLEWEATLELDGEFTNRSYLVIDGRLDYSVADLEAEFNALGIHQDLFDPDPVLHDSISLNAEIEIFNDTFAFNDFEADVYEFESSALKWSGTSLSGTGGVMSLAAIPEPGTVSLLLVWLVLLPNRRGPIRRT